ncbi:M23 family metallopeptidase [Streptomyces thermolilacinus]|uniref:Peptidase M23 n=1 Tax=Streptomyces thermolilacinus SPC6 TaxID=1306406 RepID=A0A1D3DR18_9ACTN|nr:M23 family metallopeptidase [Streptomyces thermolilacinus]OEJ94762.1 peptidase M23 [Streptomyces thermolilacinus SPC6]
MNDQHPHAGYVGDDAYATGSFTTSEDGFDNGGYPTAAYDTGSHDTGAYQSADPLYGGYDNGLGGQYDAAQWPDASTTTPYSAYTDQSGQSGQWDAANWTQQQDDRGYAATAPTYETTGQWYGPSSETYGGDPYGTGTYETTAFDATPAYDTGSYETGAYDATAWNYAPEEAEQTGAFVPEQYDYSTVDDGLHTEPDTDTAHDAASDDGAPRADGHEDFDGSENSGDSQDSESFGGFDDLGDFEAFKSYDAEADDDDGPSTEALDALDETVAVGAASAARPARRAGGSRGRRRTPARRSALLTVAVPSACVMGVAGIAAASVSGLTGTEQKDDGKAVTAADPASVKPAVANSALDTQLAALDAEALDFSDRASRTQERIDLKARQEAERKKREAEAKRREAMRPKFALPVELRQLSAGYGQAGVNWMSLHTGIDFPVQYGTPVMAATDGTVRTQWNSAYGNMVIVTAKDGTETWYCHLSSAKIRSGSVKAGEVIAYSGNSGNSTGPHLHFEVRPGGGAAIDPEAWLRNHGLNPTG